MKLDLFERLTDKIKEIALPSETAGVFIGRLVEIPSVSLIPLSGNDDVVFMDGSRDRTYNVSIYMKHERTEVIIEQLFKYSNLLDNLSSNSIQSDNNSFYFLKSTTANNPYQIGIDPKGLQQWAVDFKVQINIYKGVEH